MDHQGSPSDYSIKDYIVCKCRTKETFSESNTVVQTREDCDLAKRVAAEMDGSQ